MTILVSNANGKVGQEVVRLLIERGADLRVGARDTAKAQAEFPGAKVVALDFDRPETLAAAVAGVDSIFAATAYPLLPKAELDLLAVAKAAGVKRIVKMSALGAELDPTSPHSVVETAIQESGLAWTFLRPTFFNQNYATQSAAAVKAGAFYEPAAGGATSFVDTRDIAAVAVEALTKPGHDGHAYALTGPAALTRAEVAAILSKASGHEVVYVAVDDAALRGALAGAPQTLVELMVTLFGYVRAGYTAAVSPDVEKVLGRPARDFASFAADYADLWKR